MAGDTVAFNIGALGNVATITPAAALPTINQAILIDGYTQGGAGGAGRVWVNLDGSNVAGGTGLRSTANGVTIRGLAIYNFGVDGIDLANPGGPAGSGDTIQTCYIGTDATGRRPGVGNGFAGIDVTGGANTIGGTTANTGNVISGNRGDGIDINGATAVRNLVARNDIGTDWAGMDPLTNGGNGVLIRLGAASNTIGGASGALNVISANAASGVSISGANTNVVQGNEIGLGVDGQTWLGNGVGVSLTGASGGNTIGGTQNSTGNVISANFGDGVLLSGANVTGNVISGNYIGLTAFGNGAAPNLGNGVEINQAAQNTIGGEAAGLGNVISENEQNGVWIGGNSSGSGSSAVQNVVQWNYIGTDSTGATVLGNGANGVDLYQASQNTIDDNLISGNTANGIYFYNSNNNEVAGNYIGTDKTGTLAKDANNVPFGNGANGVYLDQESDNNTIGDPFGIDGNLISGNGVLNPTVVQSRNGVAILQASANNIVEGNYIGTDKTGTVAIGNVGDGVRLDGGSGAGNSIGGAGAASGNLISGNGIYGIETVVPTYADWNWIGLKSDGTTPLPNTDGWWDGDFSLRGTHNRHN